MKILESLWTSMNIYEQKTMNVYEQIDINETDEIQCTSMNLKQLLYFISNAHVRYLHNHSEQQLN